jgi:CxxC-x17-CxxC domain-containing protein
VSFQDRTLTCVECGTTFVFTAGEQAFYAERGFTNEPKRCPDCRAQRKAAQGGGLGYTAQRQFYPVVCDACGRETQVPFQPRGDRPVYCSECYAQRRPDRSRAAYR